MTKTKLLDAVIVSVCLVNVSLVLLLKILFVQVRVDLSTLLGLISFSLTTQLMVKFAALMDALARVRFVITIVNVTKIRKSSPMKVIVVPTLAFVKIVCLSLAAMDQLKEMLEWKTSRKMARVALTTVLARLRLVQQSHVLKDMDSRLLLWREIAVLLDANAPMHVKLFNVLEMEVLPVKVMV
jgi:hypothetical protein